MLFLLHSNYVWLSFRISFIFPLIVNRADSHKINITIGGRLNSSIFNFLPSPQSWWSSVYSQSRSSEISTFEFSSRSESVFKIYLLEKRDHNIATQKKLHGGRPELTQVCVCMNCLPITEMSGSFEIFQCSSIWAKLPELPHGVGQVLSRRENLSQNINLHSTSRFLVGKAKCKTFFISESLICAGSGGCLTSPPAAGNLQRL